ncbi:MAG: hypothetical protein RSE13_16000 [Planktothrix sp. GU0601_MAG3]|nr:MAG: hypothetical protein RSE13_16000 [Planktothrix sp. GU0601_MAG3]
MAVGCILGVVGWGRGAGAGRVAVAGAVRAGRVAITGSGAGAGRVAVVGAVRAGRLAVGGGTVAVATGFVGFPAKP